MPGHCRLSEDVGPRRVRHGQACAEGYETGSDYGTNVKADGSGSGCSFSSNYP